MTTTHKTVDRAHIQRAEIFRTKTRLGSKSAVETLQEAAADDLDQVTEIIDTALADLRDGKVAEAWEIADIAALREQVAER